MDGRSRGCGCDFGGAERGARRRGRPGAAAVQAAEQRQRSTTSSARAQHGPRRQRRGRRRRDRQRVGNGRAGSRWRARTATTPSGRSTSKYEIDRDPRRAQRDARGPQGRQERADGERRGRQGQERRCRARSASSARTSGRTTSSASSRSRPTPTAPPTPARAATYNGPTLVADIYDAAGNRIGGGNLQADRRQRVDTAYLYHGTRFVRRPQGRRRPGPASVKVASRRTATSTRSPPSGGSPRIRRRRRRRFKGVRHALQRLARGVQEDARPRGRVPDHLGGHQAAGADARLPAQGADDARLLERDTDRTRRTRRRRTSASTPTTCRSPAPRRPRPSRPARSS